MELFFNAVAVRRPPQCCCYFTSPTLRYLALSLVKDKPCNVYFKGTLTVPCGSPWQTNDHLAASQTLSNFVLTSSAAFRTKTDLLHSSRTQNQQGFVQSLQSECTRKITFINSYIEKTKRSPICASGVLSNTKHHRGKNIWNTAKNQRTAQTKSNRAQQTNALWSKELMLYFTFEIR